jgi:hypothetical protein
MPKQPDPTRAVKAQSGGGVTPRTLAYQALVIKSPVMLSPAWLSTSTTTRAAVAKTIINASPRSGAGTAFAHLFLRPVRDLCWP